MKKPTNSKKRADQYNFPQFVYKDYWIGRDYEDASERIAVKRLLNGKHFENAVDIGGGYGRLSVLLEDYADKVTLAEPSKQQLDIAKDYLKDHPKIDQVLTQADSLKFADKSFDLVAMVRVMHHLPDPILEFGELARIMTDDGYLILEVANYAHGRNRLKLLLKGRRLPKRPVDIRSSKNQTQENIPFVNHNPKTVIKQLAHAGLKVEKVLSVSNLRSPALKKVLPSSVMLTAERIMQPMLAKTYFGPSVFFLIRKAK
ncbi:class I SAM-dependent methyltransferase [Candidatus Saccharibacteria bacterium]|nr:class I SAM-dependent methyltransferase [Candidatus Saccharibacteria bacterium]MBI3338110.1 class I SAM-dependent methyltransferase [Candidatus Saccharibacteria bacterium]